MVTNFTRGSGKVYDTGSDELISAVNYLVHEELTADGTPVKWWGELTFIDSVRIHDGDRYLLELEDSRKGRCSLRRRINKAVISVPPRFFYFLQGTGPLE